MGMALARVLVVVVVFAGALTTAWAAPMRTITVPVTMARSVHALSPGDRVETLDYPATHLAFTWIGPDGAKVRYRTWSSGGTVSPWRRAPEVHGPPDAERTGRHFSAVLAVDDVVRVEWRGAGPRAAAIDRITLDYLNTLDGPRREVSVPAVAGAGDGPTIVTRAQWGANESLKRDCARSFHRLQQIFVHHTAGKNYDSNPEATMRAIYWYHVVRQGWCDIGYNFVIAPDGTVFEGRYARRYKPWEVHDGEDVNGRVVAGAHTSGYNSGSVGVSLMGNYSQIPLPPAARRSLVELLAWEVDRHGLDPRARHVYRNPESGARRRLRVIAGHRDAGSTACPGSYVYSSLRQIRREVETLKGTGRASSSITLGSTRVDHGAAATLSGTLTGPSGEGLVGKPVGSYVRVASGRWKVGPEAITGEGGRYELTLEGSRNARVIAVYEGDATTWGSQSRAARVNVAPLVTLEAEGATDVAGVSHFPGGTEQVALIGGVTPPHVELSVDVRITRDGGSGQQELVSEATVELDDAGNYRYVFVVPEDGTYRAVAIFRGDPDHASSRSDPLTLMVGP